MATLQAVARHEVERRTWCELGVVTSVFDGDDGDDAQTASVRLKDTGEVLPRVPVAVGLTGLAALPRVGDVVLVLFPHGDASSPVVVAQVYSDARRPPNGVADELRLVWPGDAADPQTDAVTVAVLADGSKREVTVTLGGDLDAAVRIADGLVELTSGEVRLALEHSSSSDGLATLAAGGTKLALAQDGDLRVTSSRDVTIKGAKIALEADVSVTINGQTVEIN
jgi:phage baseplate assembly protein gpV